MKKWICIGLFLIGTCSVQAQDLVSDFLAKTKENKVFTQVNISSRMFQMISEITDAETESIIRNLTGMKMLTTEQETDRYFQEKASSSTLNLHYTLADPESYGIARQPVHLGMISADLPEEERIRTEIYLGCAGGRAAGRNGELRLVLLRRTAQPHPGGTGTVSHSAGRVCLLHGTGCDRLSGTALSGGGLLRFSCGF